MKIGKSFEMTVSAKYQSYRFATSLEEDYPDALTLDVITSISDKLLALAVNLTMADIERQASVDPDFETVWAIRSKDLAQTKFLQNKTAGAKTVTVGERKG